MSNAARFLTQILITTTAFLVLLVGNPNADGADHRDAPLVLSNGSLDINDVYAFQSPENANNTVLIITVNPSAGIMSPTTFASRTAYEINIDNNGDAVADIVYRFYFTRPRAGRQRMLVLRNRQLVALSNSGTIASIKGGGKVTANLFDDPFFFAGLSLFPNFDGVDRFAGFNVSAIVLEVPSTMLNGATSNIGVWSRTTVRGSQFDRVGRPAINTVLIPSGRKDEFNQANPANDLSAFGADVQATINSLGGNGAVLTPILLPDVLTFDTSNAGGFLNGRRLEDDVIDAELNLLSNGGVTTDDVDANDKTFLNTFPYLASPH